MWAGLLFAVVFALAACGSVSPEAPQAKPATQDNFAYVASVDIDAFDAQADIEARYGGTAVVFKPESGFAVLGFTQEEAQLSTLSLSENNNTYSSPAVSMGGYTAWSGGRSAWSGGRSAWSGGWDAWTGGRSAWSGGRSAWSGGRSAWSGGHDTNSAEPQGNTMDNYAMWVQIGLPEAHVALAPKLGEGVTVAVVDTGVDLDHPALVDSLVPGWDFVDNDANPDEVAGGEGYGHGTSVAGIILQVAPRASIMPLRVLSSSGLGDTDDVAEAVDWAIDNGADVINLSLGSVEDDDVLERIVTYATEAGVYVISSAGNEGKEDGVTFPARRGRGGGTLGQRLISVGSVRTDDIKSDFSNYGKTLELVAPGEDVFTVFPEGQITYATGTSFASPMVAGAVALGLAENVNQSYKLDMAELLGAHGDIVDELPGNKRYKKLLGKGRLDVTSFLRGVEAIDYNDSFTVVPQDSWDLDFAYDLGDVKLRVYPDTNDYNHQYITPESVVLHAGSGKLLRPDVIDVKGDYAEIIFEDRNPELLELFEDPNIQPGTVQTLTLSFELGDEDAKGYDVPVLFEDGDKRWVNYGGDFFIKAGNEWEMKFYSDDGEVKFELYDLTEEGYNAKHIRPESVVLSSERGQVQPTEIKLSEDKAEVKFKDLKPQLIDLIANPAKGQSYSLTMSFAVGDGPLKDYPVTVTFKD